MSEYFDILNLFVASLEMMEIKGYEIDQFSYIVDVYDIFVEHRRLNKPLPPGYNNFTVEGLIVEIQKVNYQQFQIEPDQHELNSKESCSYVVQNYTTGMRTLVCFLASKKQKLNSDEFSNASSKVTNLKKILNGNRDVKEKFTFFNGLFIIKAKLGPNPNQKNKVMNNIEFIHEDIVLSRPYNNIFQSQIVVLNKSEENELFSNGQYEKNPVAPSSITENLIPSIKLNTDVFLQYLNVKEGSVLEVNREEFEEQALTNSIYYRLVK